MKVFDLMIFVIGRFQTYRFIQLIGKVVNTRYLVFCIPWV